MKLRPLALALVALALLFFAAACSGGENHPSSSAGKGESRPATKGTGAPAQPARPTPQGTPGDTSHNQEDASAQQVSTFALDVDTASYDYARRTLRDSTMPNPGHVRTEEFVNAFRQDYAEPSDGGFAVHLDGARMAENGTALLRVGLQTRRADAGARRPANLTFVVDESGSMAEPGRLDLVRDALNTLVDQLGPGDQVSIASFSDEARLLVSMTPATERATLHAAIDRLATEGSTNLEAGLVTGYQEAARAFRSVATNRVILLSDGLANTGGTAWQAILDRVQQQAAKQITLLCVGVGREYGDTLMEGLADNGDGAAIYVSSADEARKAFVDQLPANLDLRARDAKAQVAFNPAVVQSYQLLGYENRALPNEAFRNDSKDGGEVGPGHAVTALYSVRLRAGASGQLAMATVRWLDPDTRQPAEMSRSLEVSELAAGLWDGAAPRLQVDAVAAAFAEYLRGQANSPDRHFDVSMDELAAQATRLSTATEDPAVTELADLVGRARALS
jgi:Ca-activated chloride channel family protein